MVITKVFVKSSRKYCLKKDWSLFLDLFQLLLCTVCLMYSTLHVWVRYLLDFIFSQRRRDNQLLFMLHSLRNLVFVAMAIYLCSSVTVVWILWKGHRNSALIERLCSWSEEEGIFETWPPGIRKNCWHGNRAGSSNSITCNEHHSCRFMLQLNLNDVQ